jgi:hypothetical protein
MPGLDAKPLQAMAACSLDTREVGLLFIWD